jgi:WD40 repeat protein/serine/threonine protein kinase
MDVHRPEETVPHPPSDASEESLFEQAIQLASPEERRAFLDRACGPTGILRQSVDLLIRCHEQAAGLHFLVSEPTPVPRNAAPGVEGWEKPGSIIGRYRLIQTIGEGGFGVVYLAEQREPVVRQVALKIIKLGMDTKAVVARFEAERQALAMMDHPNIAQVFDGGATVTGRPYFVMERVVGSRITDFCETHQLSTRERIELFVKVCHAVQHAHQKGVIHRDLKPSNILVAHPGGPASQACPKVIDFGIAKATEARLTEATLLTQEQILMGTPAYMSPEQAEFGGRNIDTRSDIYSLGVLLYELLTGETPFDPKAALRDGIDALRRTIRESEPARPSTRILPSPTSKHRSTSSSQPVRVDEVRGDLDWIVMKCLEKDRSRRYATVNGLAFDLQRHLRDEPVEARPPSRRYRLTKWVRRNRGPLAALTAILVLLLAGVITSSLLAVRAVRAEGAERELRRRADEARESARLRAYAADMRSAGTALQANDLGRVQDLLQRYAPAPHETDLRGMEWRYLWKATRGGELQSFTLDRWVNCARFSPDDSQLACSLFGGEVRILDPGTGKVLRSFPGTGEKYAIESLSFSPDGRLLASTSAEGVVVRETANGSTVQEWPGNADAVAFSPDGTVFVRTDDAGSYFYDTGTWKPRGEFTAPAPGMGRLAFSPDNRTVAILRRALDHVDLVDLNTFQVTGTLGGFQFPLSIAFAPDGKRLAVGNSDGDVREWDLASKTPVATWKAHARYVFGLQYAPDGSVLASGGGDQLIHLWEPASPGTNAAIRKATWRGHQNEIWSLAFSRDGRRLVSAGRDATIKIWDTRGDGSRERPWNWPLGGLSLGFLRDSRHYLRFSFDPQQIELWDTEAIRNITNVPLPSLGAVVVAGSRVYVGDDVGDVRSWQMPRGELEHHVHLTEGPLRAVQADSTGSKFLGWDRTSGMVSLWNLPSGEPVADFPDFAVPEMSPSWSIPQRAAFSPDGRLLAYASTNFSVKIWDVERRRTTVALAGHVWHIQTLRFSPDGRRVVTAGWDGLARVWDPMTGQETSPPLKHQTGIASIGFSSDGRTILTMGGDTQLHFWVAATGDEALTATGGAAWFANIVAPDNNAIAWDIGDGSMRMQIHHLPTLAEIDAALPTNRAP